VISTDMSSFETIDIYIDGLFASEDDVLLRARQRAREAGLPEIEVSAGQRRFLYLMASLVAPKRILEIGTLGGYSAIWLARALPAEGALVSLELEEARAPVARQSLADAGLAAECHVLSGPALESLAGLSAGFDVIFLDANKDQYPEYLEECARLLRPGGLLLADNVIRGGLVLDPPEDDVNARGAALFNTRLAAHPAFEAIVLQQVGAKGHDGIAVARRV